MAKIPRFFFYHFESEMYEKIKRSVFFSLINKHITIIRLLIFLQNFWICTYYLLCLCWITWHQWGGRFPAQKILCHNSSRSITTQAKTIRRLKTYIGQSTIPNFSKVTAEFRVCPIAKRKKKLKISVDCWIVALVNKTSWRIRLEQQDF